MNNHYKFIFLGLFYIIGVIVINAQSTGNWQGDNVNAQKTEKQFIQGKVVDVNTMLALEYATVTFFNQQDSLMVTGDVTDVNGFFKIQINPGEYFAKVEFLSYKTTFINDIKIEKSGKVNDLGIIKLELNTAVLDVVEVRAEKSQMQIALDKKVFNVGKDLANRGGTADDLLDNIPSVAVDVEGNVSLRGNQNVRILVNGKPSGLIGVGDSNGLRQFPTSMIDRVEVITNPSARYEAEGVAGIINIILKKDNTNGLNGAFDVTVGYPETYGATVNLNYRRKAINFFGSYGLNYRSNTGGGSIYQEFYKNDTTFILDQQRTHDRGGLSNSFRFGMDYFINPKNTLTGAFIYKVSDEDNFAKIEYKDYINQFPGNFAGMTYRTDDEKESESSLSYSLIYKKTFKNDDHSLTADIQYEDDLDNEQNQYVEEYYGADYLPTGKTNLQQRAINNENNKEWRLQLDYVHPFSKDGKFEIGARSSIRQINNNYVVEEFNDVVWDTLLGLTNNFDYDENITAGYTSIGNKHGRFSYLAGLRVEYSDVSTKLLQTNEVNDRNYTNLFPNLHLAFDLPDENAIQLSYSRRINRPRYRSLTPFRSYTDSRNQYIGNPDLDPEFTHSTELGHIKYWDKATLNSAIYYRHTDGVVQRIRTIDDDGNTVTKPENLATEDAYGFEFTVTYNPMEWLKLDGDLNLYRSIIDGTNQMEDFSSDYFSWFGRVTSRMTFMESLDIQLRFNYRGPAETVQGSRKAMYFLDLAISQDLFKNNGTITLSVRDLFNSRKRQYTTFGDNFYSEGDFQWRARQIKLTLGYRLNQKKKRGGGYEGGEEGGF